MNIKRNIFLAKTEYHLMLSASIILKHYGDQQEYENRIYYTYIERRFITTFNYDAIPMNFHLICLDNNYNLKKELDGIIDFNPENFFFFQEGSPLNIYLIQHLKQMKSNIFLLQDGLKPYSIVNKRFEFLSLIRETFYSYQFLKKKNLKLKKLHLFRNYQYGVTKEIDELWLTHPEKFVNTFNKKLSTIPGFSDNSSQNAISEFFMFKEKTQIIKYWEKVIFYINQPHINPENVLIEVEFLTTLMKILPKNNGLLIKMHPLSKSLYTDLYNKIPDAMLINIGIPAELFVLNLKNSIILSGWSTTLLINNPLCNFYYNYPIFKNDKLLSQFQPTNPTDHIKVVSEPEQISFPIE